MDILFFLTGCLGLAETIDLFCGKDFLIFISDSIDPKKYNLKKVYAVEKWLFAIDTLSLFGMAFHLGGGTGDLVLAAVVLVTLFAHVYVFKSRNFASSSNTRMNSSPMILRLRSGSVTPASLS